MKPSPRLSCALLAAGISGLWLAACAPSLHDPRGLAISRGRAPEAPAPPESLQADLGVVANEPGTPPFSVRLYARPEREYRLDAFGFPSVIAVSYLWEPGGWTLVRHDKKQVWRGAGNQLEVEDAPLRLPDVHAVLGFLWGRPLPGFEGRDSLSAPGPAGEVRWSYRGEAWEARFDAATGLCREVRSSALALRYARYRRFGRAILPGETEVWVDGAPVMVLRLRQVNTAPAWKKNPFALSPPASYERREASDAPGTIE